MPTITREIAKGLIALNERIEKAKIPSSKLDETLNIATWNIRAFGANKRTEAAIHYIAEIIWQFDLVGIVQLRDKKRAPLTAIPGGSSEKAFFGVL